MATPDSAPAHPPRPRSPGIPGGSEKSCPVELRGTPAARQPFPKTPNPRAPRYVCAEAFTATLPPSLLKRPMITPPRPPAPGAPRPFDLLGLLGWVAVVPLAARHYGRDTPWCKRLVSGTGICAAGFFGWAPPSQDCPPPRYTRSSPPSCRRRERGSRGLAADFRRGLRSRRDLGCGVLLHGHLRVHTVLGAVSTAPACLLHQPG